METRRYLWIWSPVTRIPHIWWRLCRRSWFVLQCYANGKVVLLCFVSAGPQTGTSSRPNSCSRISHTSKHSVETAYTKWYKLAHHLCWFSCRFWTVCNSSHSNNTNYRAPCVVHTVALPSGSCPTFTLVWSVFRVHLGASVSVLNLNYNSCSVSQVAV